MEIKFRKKELLKTMRRVDATYAQVVQRLSKRKAEPGLLSFPFPFLLLLPDLQLLGTRHSPPLLGSGGAGLRVGTSSLGWGGGLLPNPPTHKPQAYWALPDRPFLCSGTSRFSGPPPGGAQRTGEAAEEPGR